MRDIDTRTRRIFRITGVVQGVGFRPFVYRSAWEFGLLGTISNSPAGVTADLEGELDSLERFEECIQTMNPPLSRIENIATSTGPCRDINSLRIIASETDGSGTTIVLPDIAICSDCLSDIFDESNRRYRYPFTNCTNCGPRYSIIDRLPYDRCNTTMSDFEMCDRCREEYHDPSNRRFHAQPTACPDCGPQLELWVGKGNVIKSRDDALVETCRLLRNGFVIALKGLGGFQLLVDASNDDAIKRLRIAKFRPDKPFAVMVPSIEYAADVCLIREAERESLVSIAAPITLCQKRNEVDRLSDSVAPNNNYIGIMLPYTPLHCLLMTDYGEPVVATSGNRSSEPIITDEHEALAKLSGIADYYLVHNRRIARHVDDSVVRIIAAQEMTIRRARGFAPMPVRMDLDVNGIVSFGGHQKNSVAVGVGRSAYLSQHIGDLDSMDSLGAAENTLSGLCSIYAVKPDVTACDLHPDYAGSDLAMRQSSEVVRVQHHYAHVLSCMVEHSVESPVLGVAWDGTGLGTDGTIWGGEFLSVSDSGFARTASLRTFPLPGGDAAAREPRRSAAGVLFELYSDDWVDYASQPGFSGVEIKMIESMFSANVNMPSTSSAGRLFDAVASLTGLCYKTSFEGQAAILLEHSAEMSDVTRRYEFDFVSDGEILIVNWAKMIEGIMSDTADGVSVPDIARTFHNTMITVILEVAEKSGEKDIVLTGGCFQNRLLAEGAVEALRYRGFCPYWHAAVPPNDGGLALGQLAAAARNRERGE